MYYLEDNSGEIYFFDLESVTNAYDRVQAKCTRLAKVCQKLKMQDKGMSRQNDELNKKLTLSEEETKGLQLNINKIKDELFVSRREKDKYVLKQKELVNDTTNAKDTRYLRLLTQDNRALTHELRKIYGDNKGLRMLIRKSKNHTYQQDIKIKVSHVAKSKEYTPNLRFQSCRKSSVKTTNKK